MKCQSIQCFTRQLDKPERSQSSDFQAQAWRILDMSSRWAMVVRYQGRRSLNSLSHPPDLSKATNRGWSTCLELISRTCSNRSKVSSVYNIYMLYRKLKTKYIKEIINVFINFWRKDKEKEGERQRGKDSKCEGSKGMNPDRPRESRLEELAAIQPKSF